MNHVDCTPAPRSLSLPYRRENLNYFWQTDGIVAIPFHCHLDEVTEDQNGLIPVLQIGLCGFVHILHTFPFGIRECLKIPAGWSILPPMSLGLACLSCIFILSCQFLSILNVAWRVLSLVRQVLIEASNLNQIYMLTGLELVFPLFLRTL